MKKLLLTAAVIMSTAGFAQADNWARHTVGEGEATTIEVTTDSEQAAIDQYNAVIAALNTNISDFTADDDSIAAIDAIVTESHVAAGGLPTVTELTGPSRIDPVTFTTEVAISGEANVETVVNATLREAAQLSIKIEFLGPDSAAFSIQPLLLPGPVLDATVDTQIANIRSVAASGLIGFEFGQLEAALNTANLIGHKVMDPTEIAEAIVNIHAQLTLADGHEEDVNLGITAYTTPGLSGLTIGNIR